ncbi:alpha/beta hydrolase [Devosia riboflavina]
MTSSQPIHTEDSLASGVPIRRYTAVNRSAWILVFAHGGGFSWGTLNDYDQIARNLCGATGAEVVSVGYRLAPDHPFPAGLDDILSVLRAVVSDNPAGARIALGGDSAGACLAAGAAQRALDEGICVSCQLLIYPMIEYHDRTPPAFHTLSNRYLPSFDAVRNAWDTYLQRSSECLPAYAVPTRATSLVGLPPALTIVAENDPLRFEAIAYAKQLSSAAVSSKLISYPGTGHGFLNEAPNGIVARALEDISAWFETAKPHGGGNNASSIT